MESTKLVATPLIAHFRLSTLLSPNTDAKCDCMSQVPYTSVVGNTMYVMVCTRPHLSQAFSVVSKYMTNLKKEHWSGFLDTGVDVVKWILSYLRGTLDVGLIFDGDSNTDCIVIEYVDSNFARDLDRCRQRQVMLLLL